MPVNAPQYSVVTLPAGFDSTEATSMFAPVIKECSDSDTHVALDLGSVEYLISQGLAEIIKAFKILEHKGKKLILFNVSGPVMKLLTTLNLTKMLPTAASPDDIPAILQKNTSGVSPRTKPTLQAEISKDTTILSLESSDYPEATPHNLAETLRDAPGNHMILDVSNIAYMSEDTLHELVDTSKERGDAGGRIILVSAKTALKSLIDMMKLGEHFRFADNLEDAARMTADS